MVKANTYVHKRRKFRKSNFRQYGHMEKHSQEEAQAWRKSEERRREVEKIRKRDSQKSEDAATRKRRKVANDDVFTMFFGSGGLKSRLAEAAGAEPADQGPTTFGS